MVTLYSAQYWTRRHEKYNGSGIFASPDNTTFALARGDAPGEVRRTSDGTYLNAVAGKVEDVTFSPDSTLFVVHYSVKPSELRRADGSIITPLLATPWDHVQPRQHSVRGGVCRWQAERIMVDTKLNTAACNAHQSQQLRLQSKRPAPHRATRHWARRHTRYSMAQCHSRLP
jgi:hypothetical protein